MSDRDKDKVSFSERDRRSREKRKNGDQKRPRGEGAQRRSRAASSMYRRRIDEKLFGKRGDAGRHRREERLREAHGSPNFVRTFREYVKDFGMPNDVQLLIRLLDLNEDRDVLKVIDAIGSAVEAAPEHRSLIRKRLQNLEMTTGSDALADAAADLLGRI